MVKVSKVIPILVVLCVLSFGGYIVYGEHQAVSNLEFEPYDASVSRLGFTSADIKVKMRLRNPTGYDTPLLQVEFDIYLADVYVGHGGIPEAKVLAESSTVRNMTLTVGFANVTKAVLEALRSGSFNLTMSGTVHARILYDIIPVSFPFHRQIQLQSEIRYGDITVKQARNLIETNLYLVILDVRTKLEFDSGHIEGAINIPVEEIQQRLEELNLDDEILVYCRTGVRSSKAMQILSNNGFSRVYNMLGGIEAWKQEGYPIEK